MALAKSVSKLLLAASASKACLIVVTWHFMFTFVGYFTFAFRNGPSKGHYSSQTQINAGAKIGPPFDLDSNKHRGPMWGHYSSHLLGHY